MADNRKRPTVGILVDRLEDYYQNTVFWAVADTAREHGANLLCFSGGILGSPQRFAIERNVIYDLVGRENVDGLTILAGAIGNEVGAAELERFCKRYESLPLCSIAVALEGIPSVLVDNDSGMRDALLHIIDSHGAKRIGFIRGPEVNEEAERRYQVYRDVLSERGIPFDPKLVVGGDFERESGHAAVGVLLEKRGMLMDALVAASDAQAIGAMEALGERGVDIPGEIAVIGFDDDEEARLTAPPLTTVRQPLREQGKRAVELLLAQVKGEEVPDRVTLKTELVVRGSCGCRGQHAFWQGEGEQVQSIAIEAAAAAERAQAQRRYQAERWARMLSDMGEALITSFDLSSLNDAVVEQFPRLQIQSCYISLYDGAGAPAAKSRLALAYDEEDVFRARAEGQAFPSRQLVPPETLPSDRPYTYVVEPLFFEKEELGFALFEVGPREGNIYEALRDQISAALKGARLLEQVVEKDRQRRRLVQYILGVTPGMHRVQPLVNLSQSILDQLTHLLGTRTPRAGTSPPIGPDGETPPPLNGFLAVVEEDAGLVLQAAIGRFKDCTTPDECVQAESAAAIVNTMRAGEIAVREDEIIIPLRVGEITLGVVYLESSEVSPQDIDLMRILSNQATVALQNMRLYEMAALDPLTGVHARRFFDRWMVRELRTALRSREPLSLLMMDMDDLKTINDTAGHQVGDLALALMGKALRQATRHNDIIARYGGDEFAVILPQTDLENAERVAARLRELLSEESVPGPDGPLPLRTSIGVALLLPPHFDAGTQQRSIPTGYFQGVAKALIKEADEALYRAKREGRNRACRAEPTRWVEL